MKHLTAALAAVLMLCLAAASFGQSKPAQTAPAASAPAASELAAKAANYEGTVLDKDGKPIEGATVRAFEAVGYEPNGHDIHLQAVGKLTTGQDGKYSFAPKATPVRIAFVVAQKDGLAVGFANFRLGMPGMVGSGEIRMGEPVTTGGTVVDYAGNGVAGARVNIMMHASSGRTMAVMFSLPECEVIAVTTDADGKFEFKNTPADAGVAFIVTAPGKAAIFTSQAGQESMTGEKDIKVTLPAEGRITGILKVKDGGMPIAGATIQAFPERSNPIGLPLAVTDKDGKFAIGSLPTGRVTLHLAAKEGQIPDWIVDTKSVKATAGKTKNVTLEASKGGLIEVTVLDEDTDKPIANATVGVVIRNASAPDSAAQAVTNGQGVAIVRVAPGEYGAKANVRDYSYREGGGGQPTASVEEDKTEKIEIKLKAIPMIKGVVKDADGKPVAGAEIIGPMMYGNSMKTDDAGKFSFRSNRFMYGGAGSTTTILARHVERGLAGKAELEDSDTEIAVTLEKGLTITGLVTDTSDKPIKGAKVSVSTRINQPGPSANIGESSTTDDKGQYKIPAMPKDMDFTVSATAEGYGSARSTDVTVEDKTAIATVGTLQLAEAKMELSGTVQDEDGKGVAGVRVFVNGHDQPGKQAVTDKDGKFTVKGLVEGQVSANASTPEGNRYGNVNAQAGDTDVVLTLSQSRGGPATPAAVDDDDDSDDSAASMPASAPATQTSN